MFDVCLVGHVTRDVNSFEGKAQPPRPGGTAYYAGVACRALGLSTCVVTRMLPGDSEQLLGELRGPGIEVHCLDSGSTCHFENIYLGPDQREQRVRSPGEPFQPADIAGVEARVFFFGPLLRHHVPEALLEAAKKKGARIVLEAQGLVRSVQNGEVRREPWRGDPGYFRGVDILKADFTELCLLAGEAGVPASLERVASWGPPEILATDGRRGSVIHCRRETIQVPSFPPDREIDATGCGDTYTAGYVARRLRSENIRECGRYASALAAIKLEEFGPLRTGRGNLEERILALLGGPNPSPPDAGPRPMDDHFETVAGAYSDLRTTDHEPIDYIREALAGLSPVRGADLGCGSGRYSGLLFAALADLSLTCVDSSRRMLDELEREFTARGISRFEAVHAEIERLELERASYDCICSFNAIHHLDLHGFFTRIASALKPGGQGFVYTRTPHQNAAGIWGQFFPQFLEKETRLYHLSDLVRGVEETGGLEVVAIRCFRLARRVSLDRLLNQARGRHYSTFSLYSTGELEAALTLFKTRLRERYPDPGQIAWQDGNTMLHVRRG